MAKTLLARCLATAPSQNAGLLLYRIAWWQPKATIVKGEGAPWIAKNGMQWARETGLSRNQYERGLRALKDRDLIETCRAFFGNRLITHLRLTPVGVARLKGRHSLKAEGTGSLETEGIESLETEGTKGTCTEQKEETYKYDGVLAHADGETTMKSTPGKTVKEIIAEAKMQTPASPSTPLGVLWCQQVAQAWGGYVPPLTAKQKGQLAQFAKKVPPGQAAKILRACISGWIAFTAQAEQDAGAFKTPLRPEIGFMLKFAGVAVNFAQAPAPAPKSAVKKSPFVQTVAQPAAPGVPDEYPTSIEEILAPPKASKP